LVLKLPQQRKPEANMKRIIALLFVLLMPAPLFAQMANVAQQREAMKKLERLIGRWEGTGWIEYAPGKRGTYKITETIQSKLGGIALLIEGLGKDKREGEQEEEIIHASLATITYDERAKKYRLVTHTEKGMFAIPEMKVTESGWEWGIQFPQGGGFRYTIKITDKGEWHEMGERSQDGKTWTQFHEMTLKRVK
jgi:hypothetical protein